LTSFVGRERELDEIRSLFREGKRLVTVTGIRDPHSGHLLTLQNPAPRLGGRRQRHVT